MLGALESEEPHMVPGGHLLVDLVHRVPQLDIDQLDTLGRLLLLAKVPRGDFETTYHRRAPVPKEDHPGEVLLHAVARDHKDQRQNGDDG